MEDNLSIARGAEDGFGMIQVHYIQAHLLLCGPFLTGLDQYWSVAQRLGTPALTDGIFLMTIHSYFLM